MYDRTVKRDLYVSMIKDYITTGTAKSFVAVNA